MKPLRVHGTFHDRIPHVLTLASRPIADAFAVLRSSLLGSCVLCCILHEGPPAGRIVTPSQTEKAAKQHGRVLDNYLRSKPPRDLAKAVEWYAHRRLQVVAVTCQYVDA
jgi:hypothetical protein